MDEAVGTISQAVPTANGFVETLLPAHITSPVNACRFFGGAYLTETEDGRFPCVGLTAGAGFAFSPILFRAGGFRLTLRCRAETAARCRVWLGDRIAAEAAIPVSGEYALCAVPFTAEGGFAPLRLEITEAADGCGCAIDALRLEPIPAAG